jgi:basic amino acid/polyamine antiporter, APA family
MGRDGLLPPFFSRIHPRFQTPHVTTILTGIFVAVTSGFFSLDAMVELTNIGTLFAFILVCLGVIVLRVKDPQRERPFRVPFGHLLPSLGIISCLGLMLSLPFESWLRFGAWLLVGLVIYFLYGRHHSTLNKAQ